MATIFFTPHALARMAERGVSREQVESVLDRPLRVVAAARGRREWQGRIDRDGRPMLLRVLTESAAELTVITVIATSKLDKYGGSQ